MRGGGVTAIKHPSELQRWSRDPERCRRVIEMFNHGATSADISCAIGASITSVSRFLRRSGLASNGAVAPVETISQRVIELRMLGYSGRKIASATGYGTTAICRLLRKHGHGPAYGKKRKIQIISDTSAICGHCGHTKPLEHWPTANGSKGRYYLPTCRDCLNDKSMSRANKSIESQFRVKVTLLYARCRKDGINCTLSFSDALRLWNLQDGRCAYTDTPLQMERGMGKSPNSASFDRFDPAAGYVRGNVLLVSFRANAIKYNMSPQEFARWMPEWHGRAINLLRQAEGNIAA